MRKEYDDEGAEWLECGCDRSATHDLTINLIALFAWQVALDMWLQRGDAVSATATGLPIGTHRMEQYIVDFVTVCHLDIMQLKQASTQSQQVCMCHSEIRTAHVSTVRCRQPCMHQL